MKILFYGAGVLGSLYAARLQEAGQNVSILARGRRLADIREHGIVLEDGHTGQRTTTRVNVVEQLAPDDAYDLVVVLMRKNQVSAILPVLAANRHTPNVLFMGNNAAGPDEMVQALGRERVLLGFPGAGGYREGHTITFKIASSRQQPTTFGELDGRTTFRLQQIAEVFKLAGFPVAISPNMEAWLKTHVAEISPVANAIYMAGGDNYRLARTRDGVVLMVRAIREGYKVLQALDVPITPANHKVFNWIPEPVLVVLMRRILNTKTAEIEMAGHANAARDEMKQIADEFRSLARTTSVPTPAMDRLYTYINPAAPLLPEGSAQILPSWRSV
jgi:2-dehydropantoate 2-reductase